MSELLASSPRCLQCDKNESQMWRIIQKDDETGQICNICYNDNRDNLLKELEPEIQNNNCEEKKIRKSTRTTRTRFKPSTNNNKGIPKGKSRRCIFKKTLPSKTPTITVSTRTCENLFHNGTYYQIGDIVSMLDIKDNVYYAQIKGLLVDTYCEKSAFLTWLIPTKHSPKPNENFDSSTYIIGPEEDFPRKLSCLQFVMNAPSTYYYNPKNPFPLPESNLLTNFSWKNIIDID